MSNSKFKALISIILIFVAGGAVGAILTFLLIDHTEIHHRDRGIESRSYFRDRPSSRSPFLKYLSEELNLTPEQKQEIEAVFKEARKEFEKIRKDERKCYSEIAINMRKKIFSILNEEQRAKFEKMRREHKQGRSKVRKR